MEDKHLCQTCTQNERFCWACYSLGYPAFYQPQEEIHENHIDDSNHPDSVRV